MKMAWFSKLHSRTNCQPRSIEQQACTNCMFRCYRACMYTGQPQQCASNTHSFLRRLTQTVACAPILMTTLDAIERVHCVCALLAVFLGRIQRGVVHTISATCDTVRQGPCMDVWRELYSRLEAALSALAVFATDKTCTCCTTDHIPVLAARLHLCDIVSYELQKELIHWLFSTNAAANLSDHCANAGLAAFTRQERTFSGQT